RGHARLRLLPVSGDPRAVSVILHMARACFRPVTCAAALTALVASCAVGPDFTRPAAPEVRGYTASQIQSTVGAQGVLGGDVQRFIAGAEVSSDWWILFHSAPLNDLIDHSLTNNPDLEAARAALLSAREGVLAQRGGYYPNVSAEFSATRQGQSG